MIPDNVFQQIVERSSDAILLLADRNQLIYANSSATSMLSLPDDYDGRTLKELMSEAAAETLGDICCMADQTCECEIRLCDDKRIWVEIRRNDISFNEQSFKQLTLRNISRLKQTFSTLQKQATTDFLSGLSNRRRFQNLLESSLDDRICVAVIDVDNFKAINDQFGHLLGDAAIRFVAELLLSSFGDAVCVARLGGEEFGVILRWDDWEMALQSFDSFRELVQQRHFSVEQPNLTVSIGLTFSESRVQDAHTILHQADQALYHSKNAGKNHVRVFGHETRAK